MSEFGGLCPVAWAAEQGQAGWSASACAHTEQNRPLGCGGQYSRDGARSSATAADHHRKLVHAARISPPLPPPDGSKIKNAWPVRFSSATERLNQAREAGLVSSTLSPACFSAAW